MPRRGRFDKHELLPDPVYNSLLVSRFVNKLMMRGKKGLAERILYDTIDELERRAKRPKAA
jgi:small subunit ribosomal protein S7